MDGVTEELRKLQMREAELLRELTQISVRRASIIEKEARENQSKSRREKTNSDTQLPGAPQATKGGATEKISLSKSLQIGDIVEYSGCLGFTHPRDLVGEIIKICRIYVNIRPIGGGKTVRRNVTVIDHKQQESEQAKTKLTPSEVTVVQTTSPTVK